MKTILWLTLALAVLTLAHGPIASAHWPDQAPHQFADLGEFEFEGGGKIPNMRMSYITRGKLNAAKTNAILFMHGFGLNHHQADHLIGPGEPLDTDKYFIICSDELGNTQTTFEHSTSPSNSGLKMDFPPYNGRDIVNATYKLLTERLGITRLFAATGISIGAYQIMQLEVSYPGFTEGLVPIAGGALWGTQGYFRGPWMLSIIESCAGWNDGDYDENPPKCATNAVSAFIPYFYSGQWWQKYVDTPEAYTRWRVAWGDYYLDIQDARDLHYHVVAMGRSWLGDTPGFNNDVMAALRSIKAKTVFITSPYDQFYVPEQIEIQATAIQDASVSSIDSIAGHLICCTGDPQATWEMGQALGRFLDELGQQRHAAR
jgi:homoserine O-acetyltransferase